MKNYNKEKVFTNLITERTRVINYTKVKERDL